MIVLDHCRFAPTLCDASFTNFIHDLSDDEKENGRECSTHTGKNDKRRCRQDVDSVSF